MEAVEDVGCWERGEEGSMSKIHGTDKIYRPETPNCSRECMEKVVEEVEDASDSGFKVEGGNRSTFSTCTSRHLKFVFRGGGEYDLSRV